MRLLVDPDTGDNSHCVRLLALLSTARRKLAVAKVPHTIEFVENAVAQGEKVIVFSCFDEPLQTLRKKFGDAAVILTGATPTSKRQGIVDRLQHDDSVRVFAANIIAGGIGLDLTAARHVVFNDLDWVPAKHWQAGVRRRRRTRKCASDADGPLRRRLGPTGYRLAGVRGVDCPHGQGRVLSHGRRAVRAHAEPYG